MFGILKCMCRYKHSYLPQPTKCVVFTVNPQFLYATEKFHKCKSTWKCNPSGYG